MEQVGARRLAPNEMVTVAACERALGIALEELRQAQRTGPSNLLAAASIESRIGAIRRRQKLIEAGPSR